MPSDPNNPDSLLTYILTCIFTGLSIIACLWTCYNCSKLPISKNVSLKFILAIIIFDLCLSCTHLLEIFHDFGLQPFCKIEAYFRPIFYMGNFCLAILMGVLGYKALAQGEAYDQNKFFFKSLFGTFAWSALLMFAYCFSGIYTVVQETAVPTICHLQKEANLSKAQRTIAAILLNNTFPVGVGLIILIFTYVKIIKMMNRLQINVTGKTGSNTLKLMYFPTIQILLALPGLIFHAFNYPAQVQWFLALFLTTQHSVGLVNSIVFGFQMKSYSARLHKKSQFFLRISSDSASSGTVNEL